MTSSLLPAAKVWPNRWRLYFQARGLEVVASSSDEYPYLIRPTGKAGVYLQFDHLGDRPSIGTIRNYSLESGWGTALVEALITLYPNAKDWPSTLVRDSGVEFWAKMQDRFGLRLVDDTTGTPLLSAEVLTARLADIRKAEEQFGDGAFRVPRETVAKIPPPPPLDGHR